MVTTKIHFTIYTSVINFSKEWFPKNVFTHFWSSSSLPLWYWLTQGRKTLPQKTKTQSKLHQINKIKGWSENLKLKKVKQGAGENAGGSQRKQKQEKTRRMDEGRDRREERKTMIRWNKEKEKEGEENWRHREWKPAVGMWPVSMTCSRCSKSTRTRSETFWSRKRDSWEGRNEIFQFISQIHTCICSGLQLFSARWGKATRLMPAPPAWLTPWGAPQPWRAALPSAVADTTAQLQRRWELRVGAWNYFVHPGFERLQQLIILWHQHQDFLQFQYELIQVKRTDKMQKSNEKLQSESRSKCLAFYQSKKRLKNKAEKCLIEGMREFWHRRL